MSNRVAIVVLNYAGYKDTIQCVVSILGQEYPDFKILLVDNCSPDNSIGEITGYLSASRISFDIVGESDIQKIKSGTEISIIVADRNMGYAYGNNLALRYAVSSGEFKYYWVLNNDTVVNPDTLTLMVGDKETDKYNRPVGNFIYYYDTKDKLQMAGGLTIDRITFKPSFAGDVHDVDYLSGASYLIDNNFIKEYGLMYEGYFLNSEDLEYFYLYKIQFTKKHKGIPPFIVVGTIYHKESATQGKYTPFSSYYYSRNLFYSCRKLKRVLMPGLMLFMLCRFIKWSLKDRAIAASIVRAYKDYLKGIAGKVDYF